LKSGTFGDGLAGTRDSMAQMREIPGRVATLDMTLCGWWTGNSGTALVRGKMPPRATSSSATIVPQLFDVML